MLNVGEITSIRRKVQDIGNWSHTSITFQNQLLTYVEENAASGDHVIEVGCYRGGLTAQLAHLTYRLHKALYVVDIDQGMLDQATLAVKHALGFVPNTTHFHAGDLKSFLAQKLASNRCILLFIDGDHNYDGVMADIRAASESELSRPLTMAFHDYSLRYARNKSLDVRVDEAVRDGLGSTPLFPLGETAGVGSTLRVDPAMDGDDHYHRMGSPEGVMAILS